MPELMMMLARLPTREEEALPDGCRARAFRAGDSSLWVEIQSSTGVYGAVGQDLFDREFGYLTEDHAERILFLESSDEAVGVSAAWRPGPKVPKSAGRVHWVAVVPSHQRRGLGRALVLVTLRRLRELEYTSAYLTTGSDNLPAIDLYRKLGFEPVARTAEERAAWRDLAPGRWEQRPGNPRGQVG